MKPCYVCILAVSPPKLDHDSTIVLFMVFPSIAPSLLLPAYLLSHLLYDTLPPSTSFALRICHIWARRLTRSLCCTPSCHCRLHETTIMDIRNELSYQERAGLYVRDGWYEAVFDAIVESPGIVVTFFL